MPSPSVIFNMSAPVLCGVGVMMVAANNEELRRQLNSLYQLGAQREERLVRLESWREKVEQERCAGEWCRG